VRPHRLLLATCLLLGATAILLVLLPDEAQAAHSSCTVDHNTCQGDAFVRLDGTGGAWRKWAFKIHNSQSDPSDRTGWEINAGACVNVYFRLWTSGALPPGAAETIILRVYYDNTGTQVREFHNGAVPADQTTYSFCSTSDGTATGSPRTGTYRLYIRVIRTTAISYDIDSDGTGAPTQHTRGYVRGMAQATQFTHQGYPGTGQLTYAYGTSADETATIATTIQDRFADNNVETLRAVTRKSSDLSLIETGTTVEVGTSGQNTHAFTIDDTYPTTHTRITADLEIVGNAALTGRTWTRWATSGHATGITRISDTVLRRVDAFNADAEIRFSTTAPTPRSPLIDSSGNGFDLTAINEVGLRNAQQSKYGTCAEFDGLAGGTADYLKRADSALNIMGDFSAFLAFETDTIQTSQSLFYYGSGQLQSYFADLLSSNQALRIGSPTASSNGINTVGFHTLEIQRDNTAKRYVVKFDGVIVQDRLYSSVATPDVQALYIAARINSGVEPSQAFDGAICELRIWNTVVPFSILDKLADYNDQTYTNTPVGTERALYFFGPPNPNAKANTVSTVYNRGTTASYDFWIANARSDAVSRSATLETRASDQTLEDTQTQTGPHYAATYGILSTDKATHDLAGDPHSIKAVFTGATADAGPTFGVSSLLRFDQDGTGTPDGDVKTCVTTCGPGVDVFNRGETLAYEAYLIHADGTQATFDDVTWEARDDTGTVEHTATLDPTAAKYSSTFIIAATDKATPDTTGSPHKWQARVQGNTADSVTNAYYVSSQYRFDQDGTGTPDGQVQTTYTVYNRAETVTYTFYLINARGDQGTETATIQIRASDNTVEDSQDLNGAAYASNYVIDPADKAEANTIGDPHHFHATTTTGNTATSQTSHGVSSLYRFDTNGAGTPDGCFTTNHPIYNRGETPTYGFYVMNARAEQVAHTLTVNVRASDQTVEDTQILAGPNYASSYTIDAADKATADAIGDPHKFRASGSGNTADSTCTYGVSSKYWVDAHVQRVNPLQKDDFPTQDAAEYFDHISGEDLIQGWCHIKGIRFDLEIDTGATDVEQSYERPDATQFQSRTTETGSDGWTANAVGYELVAQPPTGVWSLECTTAYQGNTGSDTEGFNVVSAFSGNLELEFTIPSLIIRNSPATLFVRTTMDGECLVPTIAQPVIQITHVDETTTPETTVTDVDDHWYNVVDETQSVNGCLYKFTWTPTQATSYNLFALFRLGGKNITDSTPFQVVLSLPNVRILIKPELETGVQFTIQAIAQNGAADTTPLAPLTLRISYSTQAYAWVDEVPSTAMRNVVTWTPTVNGARYAYNWTPAQAGVFNVEIVGQLTDGFVLAQQSVNVLDVEQTTIFGMTALPGLTGADTTLFILALALLTFAAMRGWWFIIFTCLVAVATIFIPALEDMTTFVYVLMPLALVVQIVAAVRQARRGTVGEFGQ
jgi:hypothetical protein